MATHEPHEIVINLDDSAARDEYGRPGGEMLLRVAVIQNGKRSMVYLRALMWTGHPTKAGDGVEFFLSHVKATKDIDRALYVKPWYVAKHCDHCGNEGQRRALGTT